MLARYQTRGMLNAIDAGMPTGLRDRARIGLMKSFAAASLGPVFALSPLNNHWRVRMRRLNYSFVVLLAALLVTCARDKEPAEAAIKQAAQAIEQIRGEASRYAPDQFKQLEDSLRTAQDSFAKKDYKAAWDAATNLGVKAQEVAKAAADKKADLKKSWDNMSVGIPQMMQAIKGRLDILAHAKKLPAGMDKDKLAALASGYDDAIRQFQKAKDAASAGDPAKAIEAGEAIRQKAIEIATTLGLRQ